MGATCLGLAGALFRSLVMHFWFTLTFKCNEPVAFFPLTADFFPRNFHSARGIRYRRVGRVNIRNHMMDAH
jgi:hypothetical protein